MVLNIPKGVDDVDKAEEEEERENLEEEAMIALTSQLINQISKRVNLFHLQ